MTELRLAAKDILPADGPGLLVGRVWSAERGGPCPVVLDHFGMLDPRLGPEQPGFAAILRLLDSGRVWVKLSAAYRNSVSGDGTIDALDVAHALRTAFTAERLVWGSDWPHTQHRERVDFDAAYAALARWLPDPGERLRVLRDSPSTLFRFDQ